MKHFFYLLLFLTLPLEQALGQTITNVRAETSGDVINVYYDLQGTAEGQLYQITLYSSHNDMAQPLTFVSGDTGPNVQAGAAKKIEWQAKKEILRYTGQITFEVQASLLLSPLRIKSPALASSYKRGKSYPLTWEGGMPGENVRLELFQGTSKVNDIARVNNNGTYTWSIPAATALGNNYKIKVISVDKPDNSHLSENFAIKRKVSTVVKVLPVAVLAGAAVYLITSGGGGGGNGPDPVNPASKLPEPPTGQ
ncbi:hypothetical protein GXP67_33855 [Rhodocytophaga rosea]|uniref:Yeast cell wall synthesis Kre9/Knh1-like N-terminal domain-containing protein n=1 Tax=Rhodocytophaga rosea TaxID=2704465 RepID=A0A6C0GT06_9BACT|nr:Ser-Thr-rich GPI-anchored membrane family protein [Rhodocytophaga rosea]QHT71288.1 hypothetical protein GXP67_33855 [Rhodocytophaga rosea]